MFEKDNRAKIIEFSHAFLDLEYGVCVSPSTHLKMKAWRFFVFLDLHWIGSSNGWT